MSAVLITIGRLAEEGPEHLDLYAAQVIPLIARAGGQVLHRFRPIETVVGSAEGRPDLVAAMRFESPEAIRAFLASDDYALAVPSRERAFVELKSFIAEDI